MRPAIRPASITRNTEMTMYQKRVAELKSSSCPKAPSSGGQLQSQAAAASGAVLSLPPPGPLSSNAASSAAPSIALHDTNGSETERDG